MFDLTDQDSFDSALLKWRDQISQSKDMPVILVANKSDKKGQKISAREIERMAEQYGLRFFITSAITGD